MAERQSGSMDAITVEPSTDADSELSLRTVLEQLASYWQSWVAVALFGGIARILYGIEGVTVDVTAFALAALAVVGYRLFTLPQDIG